MDAKEAAAVNAIFAGLRDGRLGWTMGVLSALMRWAHESLGGAGATELEVERWTEDLPAYLVMGDKAAARAGDWGWMEISDDCRPADLVEVLLRHADDEAETVSIGFRARNGAYLVADNSELRLYPAPTHWMPLPYPGTVIEEEFA